MLDLVRAEPLIVVSSLDTPSDRLSYGDVLIQAVCKSGSTFYSVFIHRNILLDIQRVTILVAYGPMAYTDRD